MRLFWTFSRLFNVFLMVGLLAVSHVSWAEVVGRVLLASGQVTATDPSGNVRELARRSEIYAQDTLRTGAQSKVQIRFVDQGLLTLSEGSQLNIHSYQQGKPETGEESKILMELVEGGFRSLTGHIGKGTPEAYQVQTPNASIGIRGTLFSIQVAPDEMLAGVWQGGIRLTTEGGEQYDLGLDVPFRFGVLNKNGFTGLVEAPAGLERLDIVQKSPASKTSDAEENTLSIAQVQQVGEVSHQVSMTLAQQQVAPTVPEVTPPVYQPVNYDEYHTEQQASFVFWDEKTQTWISGEGKFDQKNNDLLLNERTEQSLQVSAVLGGKDRVDPEFRLASSDASDMDSLADILAPFQAHQVGFGYWEGNANNPITAYSPHMGGSASYEPSKLYYINAQGIELDATQGHVSMQLALVAGEDSLGGRLTGGGGGFGLDLATGELQGDLSLRHTQGDMPTSEWGVNFQGTLINGSWKSNAEGSVTFGQERSELQGQILGTVFGGKNDPKGAISTHHLQGTYQDGMGVNQPIHASGVLGWKAN